MLDPDDNVDIDVRQKRHPRDHHDQEQHIALDIHKYAEASDALLDYIRENVFGKQVEFVGPYGPKKITYCDYVASAKPLRFLEEYIWRYVFPYYANTHTATGLCGLQTTAFREDARNIIKQCVNAGEEDVLIFVGSGTTTAIHKLINAMQLKDRAHNTTVIFGPYEHHSNILPWKEVGVKTERVGETFHGLVDMDYLEKLLKGNRAAGRDIVVAISAASNVTGIKTDSVALAELCHRYDALSVWDYAAAAPYVDIDMNPTKEGYKDAIFLSPHKFIGGPGTPGILIAKRHMFKNLVPGGAGGGTVHYVTRETHFYIRDIEEREEGGTPAITESIRCGLVFQLKEAIGPHRIEHVEHQLVKKALSVWRNNRNLAILGSHSAPRLPIFSFLIRNPESGKLLHQNYVSTLLSDLYGIQNRGGCACAGPYAQDLLKMHEELSVNWYHWFLEHPTETDDTRKTGKSGKRMRKGPLEIMRPGFSRLNLAYFMDEETLEYVIHAVDMVATHGWKLLPLYNFDQYKATWRHHKQPKGPKLNRLLDIGYSTDHMVVADSSDIILHSDLKYDKMAKEARKILLESEQRLKRMELDHVGILQQPLDIPEEQMHLVWFMQPVQALAYIKAPSLRLVNFIHEPLAFSPRDESLTRARKNWRRIAFANLQYHRENLPLGGQSDNKGSRETKTKKKDKKGKETNNNEREANNNNKKMDFLLVPEASGVWMGPPEKATPPRTPRPPKSPLDKITFSGNIPPYFTEEDQDAFVTVVHIGAADPGHEGDYHPVTFADPPASARDLEKQEVQFQYPSPKAHMFARPVPMSKLGYQDPYLEPPLPGIPLTYDESRRPRDGADRTRRNRTGRKCLVM